jgi:hypothetical protein
MIRIQRRFPSFLMCAEPARSMWFRSMVLFAYYDTSEEAERTVVEGSIGPIGLAEKAGARYYVGHFGNDARSRRMLDTLVERTSSMAIVLTTENQTGQPLSHMTTPWSLQTTIGCAGHLILGTPETPAR